MGLLDSMVSRLRRWGAAPAAGSAGPGALSLPECRSVLGLAASLGESRPLGTRAEMEAASTLVRLLGLPSHHDPQKNWDTLKCLHWILREVDPSAPVLDVGSSRRSVILNWLLLLGYKDLQACDLRDTAEHYRDSAIRFSIQDLARTEYPDAAFAAVTSISVIEHGVHLDRYVSEMARILRPGGLLLTSTDYWSEPVDCTGIRPYGPGMPQMKVFGPGELEEFARLARQGGFEPCSPLDLRTGERVVHWERVDRRFTFAFIALRKERRQ